MQELSDLRMELKNFKYSQLLLTQGHCYEKHYICKSKSHKQTPERLRTHFATIEPSPKRISTSVEIRIQTHSQSRNTVYYSVSWSLVTTQFHQNKVLGFRNLLKAIATPN